jgi:hypothetical protein
MKALDCCPLIIGTINLYFCKKVPKNSALRNIKDLSRNAGLDVNIKTVKKSQKSLGNQLRVQTEKCR